MRGSYAVFALSALALACRSRAPGQSARPAEPTHAAQQPTLDPPPPAEVVVPAIGTARDVTGGPGQAYVWAATFDVDPSDPRIAAVIEQHRPHGAEEERLAAKADELDPNAHHFDAGQAGAELYLAQARSAGRDCRDDGYLIQGGALYVSVISGRSNVKGLTPRSFQVYVTTPGG